MSGSRMQKINNQMKRDIGIILQQDFGDPRLSFVSITSVDCSPDLRNAKIFYSVLGDEEKAKEADGALKSAAGAIRRKISQRMNMRVTPEIAFVYDKSIAHSFEIEEAIRKIHDDED